MALERASAAGHWDAVVALASELRERRLARAGNVVLKAAGKAKDGSS